MARVVVALVIDAAQPADAHAAHVDHASEAEEVDIGCSPPTIRDLAEVAASLMVATDKDGEHGRDLLARVVLVEGVHRAVLGRARQPGEVGWVSHRLEVSADEQNVHLDAMLLLCQRQRCIDVVEFAMAAALNSDLCKRG